MCITEHFFSQRDNSGGQDATKFNFVDIQFTKPTNCEKWTEMIGYEVHRRQYTSSLDLCPYYVVSIMRMIASLLIIIIIWVICRNGDFVVKERSVNIFMMLIYYWTSWSNKQQTKGERIAEVKKGNVRNICTI